MPVQESDRKIVKQVFDAMHAGLDGENAMASLFLADGVLVEPFSGQVREHRGDAAIRTWFREAINSMPPDMSIKLDRLDLEAGLVRADWTCTSPVLPSPIRGYDLYTLRDGRISRLEIVVTEMPPQG
ncbi:MAG: nuclear transport factor 2 family protein [Planctomycetia bacterium]|nr:MAG: nuclear transport factor 2 family protein [Planctomycetia bacterium]